MPSFTSSQSTVDILASHFGAGTYYIELVTVVPTRSVSTVADLTLATGGNYVRKAVTLTAAIADGTGGKVSTTNPVWAGLTNNSSLIRGLALIQQVGGAPASVDKVRSFIELGTTTVVNCTTTTSSPTISAASGLSAFIEGYTVSGAGIPSGTVILKVVSDTQIILSKLATATAVSNSATLSFTSANTYLPNGADFTFVLPSSGLYKVD